MGVNCTICGNSANTILADGTINRYDCVSCGHSFSVIEPSKQVSYNADYYDLKHANWFSNPNIWLFRYILKQARIILGDGRISVVDVGCGKADFLKYARIKDRKVDVYGIDLCDNDIPDIAFYRADFLKTEINRKFDLVTSMASIEHVEDVNSFVRRLANLSSQGGIISVTTDNAGGIFFSLSRFLKKAGLATPYYSLYEPAHLQHFTNKSLRILLEKNGLKVISQRNHNYPAEAVDMPDANPFMKMVYILGVRFLFAMPSNFGILQTAICRKERN